MRAEVAGILNGAPRDRSRLPCDLPAGWSVRRLKHVAAVRVSNVDKKTVEGEQPVRLCNYVDVYKNDFLRPGMEFMQATATAAQIAKFTLKAGDVLITKDSEEWTDIAVPAYVEADMPGVLCGYHLAHLRPKPDIVEGRFLFRAIGAEGIADQFRFAANGITRFGLSIDDISNALIPIPPVLVQRDIAAFLDSKTRHIDEVITKKRRLIDRLHEREHAVISHAVTGGLSSKATKDSGTLAWGEIPANWQMTELRYLTPDNRPIMYGIVLPGPHVDDGVPIVKGGNCEPGRLKLGLLSRTTREIEASYARSRLRRDDIVYAIRGSIGSAELVPVEIEGANITQDAARIAPKAGVNPRWMLYAVRSHEFFSKLDAGATGATIRGINIRDLKRADIAVPPPHEQAQIANYLDEKLRLIRFLIERQTASIDRLQEYRQNLISAAVTGQMVVPSATATAAASTRRRANKHFHRVVLAAEIVDRHQDTPKFGRVKLQKAMCLAELHLNLDEIQSQPVRAAAGPFDNPMMQSVHKQLAQQKWFRPVKGEKGYRYDPMVQRGEHRRYFDRYWGDRHEQFDALMAMIKPMTTRQAEIVATLYSAWNDFIIKGEPHDDDRIVREVLTNWNESKASIAEETWRKALAWMKQKGLVPRGFGSATRGKT